jgi:hypothetical protein
MALRVVGDGNISVRYTNKETDSPSSPGTQPSRRSSIDAQRKDNGLVGLPPRPRASSLNSQKSEVGPVVLTPPPSTASIQATMLTPTTSHQGSANVARTSSTASAKTDTTQSTRGSDKARKPLSVSQLNSHNKLRLNEAAEKSAKIAILGLATKQVMTAHTANAMHAAFNNIDVPAITADKELSDLKSPLMRASLAKAAEEGKINSTEKRVGELGISVSDTCHLVEKMGLSADQKESVLNMGPAFFEALVPEVLKKVNGRLPENLSNEVAEGLKDASNMLGNPKDLLKNMINFSKAHEPELWK